MKIIGIDIGTTLGWAMLDDGAVVDSGAVDLHPHAWEGIGMRVVRARRTTDVLAERHPGAVVVVELVRRHVGTQAAQVYGAILGGVTSRCEEIGMAYTFVSVQAAKLAATGDGAAGKPEMIRAARERLGIDASEDEADAAWIGVAGWLRERDPTRPAEGQGKPKRRRKA